MDIRLLLLLAACLLYRPVHAAPAAPADNAVQPCDHSSATGKPPCDADTGSIVVPPEVPTAPADTIEPPPVSNQGVPDRGLPEPPDPVPPTMPLEGPDSESPY